MFFLLNLLYLLKIFKIYDMTIDKVIVYTILVNQNVCFFREKLGKLQNNRGLKIKKNIEILRK